MNNSRAFKDEICLKTSGYAELRVVKRLERYEALLLPVKALLVTISSGAISGCTDAFEYKLQGGSSQCRVTDSIKAVKSCVCKSFNATSGYPTAPVHPTLGTALPRHSGAAELRLLKIESELLKKQQDWEPGRVLPRHKSRSVRSGLGSAGLKSHGENVIAGCVLPCAILVRRLEKRANGFISF